MPNETVCDKERGQKVNKRNTPQEAFPRPFPATAVRYITTPPLSPKQNGREKRGDLLLPYRSSPPGETRDAAVGWVTADSEENRNGGNAAGDRGRRPVWSVPVNGASEAGPVMGADCWPSLPESASRASVRSSFSDSLMALSDGTPAAAALV
ncbi:hypothetical protein BHE74_00039481 [Ensete ventricosum]|nr:hypothetical protein GW17_00005093 [Ensete ventricosum]RWW53969.1 hypothetical protein BHE74_00039481 [Ensete ventricosum]